MYYENVKLKAGDTVSQLAIEYGYRADQWNIIWNDPKNTSLKSSRSVPNKIKIGDELWIPIPWTVFSKSITLNAANDRVIAEFRRNGLRGKRLRWVQTVDRANQPIGAGPRYCVDPCSPPDDEKPFYYTNIELGHDASRRKKFYDRPFRHPPAPPMGTTHWRAILSLAVTTDKRVTIFESYYWGFDKTTAGVVRKVGPRAATAHEISGHLRLLKAGSGTAGKFSAAGWTFRTRPAP
jgi:hypothetical protein